MAPSRSPLPTLISVTAILTFLTSAVSAQPGDPDIKYKFFCGSSFADIQTSTCSSRQWCPSSSDDECVLPGHSCFANTPCDAREVGDVQVPTYSLSLNPEFRDPTDKMFCGADYADAESTCDAGGDKAIGRHCPDMTCPNGQTCYIDLPCSYFVLTDPLSNPLGNVNELDAGPVDLPTPGSLSSHYFCGPTFQEAARTCSYQSWCQSGASQECPQGETCFVGVNVQNDDCEINAIVKADYNIAQLESDAQDAFSLLNPGLPTPVPTHSPLNANDPKNQNFCGRDWNDASDNCVLERFCPNGDGDCPEGMSCWDYTQCDAVGMTGTPTSSPTPAPSKSPTSAPINTSPTQTPTTSKPSRDPTTNPTYRATPKPTGVPSKKPTHMPLEYGDFRRGFWCGRSYFDAMDKCAVKCPGGETSECPTLPDGTDLLCMSGVTSCKNEMGLGAYDTLAPTPEANGLYDGANARPLIVSNLGNARPTAASAVMLEEEAFYELGSGKQTVSKPSGGSRPATTANDTVDAQIQAAEDAAMVVQGVIPTTSEPTANPTAPLQGPFTESMVRIVLYGLPPTTFDDSSAIDRWRIMTRMYMEKFYNQYPSSQMLAVNDQGSDTIRNSVYDVVVEITGGQVEMAPVSIDFSDLVVGSVGVRDGVNDRRNLRDDAHRRAQSTIDPDKTIMITYTQTTSYRSNLDVINDDPTFISSRPLETTEYRADYVNFLRAQDFQTFGNLEFVSRFLYSEFPTRAPTLAPVEQEEPTTAAPTGGPPTPNPTENFGCNLCEPGQYGVNANVIFNGDVQECMEVYNWFLDNYNQGSGQCNDGFDQLNAVCCRWGMPVSNSPVTNSPSKRPTLRPTPRPVAAAMVESNPPPTPQVQNPPPTPQVQMEPNPPPTPQVQNPPPTPQAQPRPNPPPTPSAPTEVLEIPVDDLGLPDATTLAETYYCGTSWDSVDRSCASAVPCPSGDISECPDNEQCIAFTNCGGKFAFVSDPEVEGGGPNADSVRKTFYCGTSMQFLENVCVGATPCPNGPNDCEGDGEKFGCFAFTGCDADVDPGSFVGFLKPPDGTDANSPLPDMANLDPSANSFYCAKNWNELDSMCVGGSPEDATACPSGDILECDDGEGCFAFACNNFQGMLPKPPSPTSSNTNYVGVEDMDLLKTTFFCGTSIEEIDGDCDNSIACPSGDECPPGFGCFAFSQCGGVDVASLVDSFGNTERPSRAPTVPLVQICDEEKKMSVNVGYWQSWSIYRDEDCQRMDTSNWDATPYSHVVYSFASIDSAFRLEAWDGTYDNEVPLYKEFQTVKQRHPGTKTMIAVGGWTHNDPGPMQSRFSDMAGSKTNRQTFANSVVQFMRTYGFDGLDLDWEYPGLKSRGGKRADYDNYVKMTETLRASFNAAPEPFELTIAIPGNLTKLEMGFDLAGLAENVDWFNIMAYDLWGSWDPQQVAMSHTDIRMIDEAVEYMSHFIQRSKLVMGLGSYARTYTLADSDCLDLECPFEGPGEAGCEGTDGFLPYFEIADMVTNRQYDSLRFDDNTESMVMVTDGNRLISYDNTVSFNRKLDYAKEMCMQGGMLWAIDMLKDGSNPLSSNNGNSAATGDASDQSFCGKDYQDVIDGCKQPCTSGDSSQCSPGESCFANTGCSLDNIGAPPPSKCRLCPDPSTQGIMDWLEVDFDGDSMTCGDADMTVISEFAKGSGECDAAKQALGDTCCYTYPESPCMLCRSETEFMDLRALEEIEFDGESMTCYDLSKRLGPQESDSEMCSAAQGEHWDACCYNQCTLCESKGVKWWTEVEYEEEPLNCGELDAMLYADETEEDTEQCSEVLGEFGGECCYDYPDDPCDVCNVNGKKLTLMPNEEIDYEGSTFTCAEVNNFLSPFESTSSQCEEVKGLGSDTCCFDRCSLCGEGARLDADIIVDIEGEEGLCADVESALFTEKETSGSEECTDIKSLHYDACCFEIPSEPCQLCGTEEYMHHTTTIDFNDEEVSCRSAGNFLQERHEMTSNTCMDAKAALGETCCYSICNICGEFDLDWDVFVNYEGSDMNCGDFNEIFREESIVDGSQQCSALQDEFKDTCCYSSPTTSCQLCKQGETFFDLNDNVEVDFNGPTTCYEVANFMSRRTEDTDPVCGVTQASLFDECCYEKCDLASEEGTYPDWSAEVEMDGNVASCLELEAAIKDAAIPTGSSECDALQDAFSPTCSYRIPTNACDICPDNAVSIEASAEWNGEEMKCSEIKTRISSREEAESDICVDAQSSIGGSCCIDQCEVCDKAQKTDFVMTVYHEGKTKQCTEVDIHFYEKSILASSEECSATKSELSDCCFDEPESPCNLCKKEEEYFDLMGENSVTYMGEKMTCTDLSDTMFRREEGDGEKCSTAKENLFDACCDTKCSLCAGQGLEAGVKVSYEGRMMTCLELDLDLGPASIEAGSDQCAQITSQHSGDCCYEKPESPCRICPGDDAGVDKEASVNYLGSETTCESLSNYLGSREEQGGNACQTASSDHSEDCCFERCSLCDGGKADWETFVTYEGQSVACGDFEWILRGKSVAANSGECDAVKDEFYDKCCFEPPETSCNLCKIGSDYLDVSAEVDVNYQGSQMKCLSLYNSLFVREDSDSDQCEAAKDEHGESCCFKKCDMCQVGFLDSTATVNVDGTEMSCSALDMSFSKDVVVDGSAQCSEKRSEYADACCYTLPDNPCRVCPAGSDVNGDVSVIFNGEAKSCGDIGNKLATSEEAGTATCSATQQALSAECCFERCPICPEGFNLNWEVDVEYNRATIACGEFDNLLRGNAIQKGTQECGAIRSTYSSACCYNYATNGVGYATETTLATVTTTGYLSTNLDTSTLTPVQEEDSKRVFANLIKNTLSAEGVLPPDSTVTVIDIDANGVVQYEIEMAINDSVASNVASQVAPPPPDNSSLGDISNEAVSAIGITLSDTSRLDTITEDIQSQAPQATDLATAQELSAVSVSDFALGDTQLTMAGEDTALVITPGSLATNIDTSDLTNAQQEETINVVESSIENTLQSQGVISQSDKVTVKNIDDAGEVEYEVQVNVDPGSGSLLNDAALEDISTAVAAEIDSALSDTSTLEAISDEIVAEAASSSAPVASELSDASVSGSALGQSSILAPGESKLSTVGVLDTNIDTSALTAVQKEDVIVAVEESIEYTLQSEGVLSQGDTVTVLDIDDEGGVKYEVDLNADSGVDDSSSLGDISTVAVSAIDTTMSDSTRLDAILEEIQSQAAQSTDPTIARELAALSISDFALGETTLTIAAEDTASVINRSLYSALEERSMLVPGESKLSTTGVLNTNIDTSKLTAAQEAEIIRILESSIGKILQADGVLSQGDTVTVLGIDDKGVVKYVVNLKIDSEVNSALEEISVAVVSQIDSTLSDTSTLDGISEEIKDEGASSSAPVLEKLSNASVFDSSLGQTTLTTKGGSSEVSVGTAGTLDTNIDPTSLTAQEKEEMKNTLQTSIANSLQSQGVLPDQSTVIVNEIDDEGKVYYEIEMIVDHKEDDSSLEEISIAVVSQIGSTLSNPLTLEAISEEIKDEGAISSAPVSEELSNAVISDSSRGQTTLTANGDSSEVSVSIAGILDTNIDTTSLTAPEKEEAKEVIQTSIANSLQSQGVLPEQSTVTVADIDNEGEVFYEIEMTIGPEIEAPPPQETTNLQAITESVVSQIDSTLSDASTLETISSGIEAESADSSVAEELSGVTVSDFVQGETSVSSTGAVTGAGPCNLCKAGEIGLDNEILFNGVQTSCPEVYKFLSNQAEAGSDACVAGKNALHSECCMKKCDLCSGGGIPDWYSMVNVNGNSMTCLELDGIVAESEIQGGSGQCGQLLEVAAPACCYEPPTKPCNMCASGSEFTDVMSSVIVEYGGTTATCGQIFNTLFSREENDGETCSLIKQDLASQCCYNKCSLCGDLQTNAGLTVIHDGTEVGCSQFDSYLFASSVVEEGSNECLAFQDEHRDACCYDISCSLCAKGNDLYTTKETTMVQYSGSEVACGEVANFLFQQQKSQDNACLAAKENVFSDCCFQQCELCEVGASINWAAQTSFNGLSQSCTDVYWSLVSESVESDSQTCSTLSQASADCCFQIPSQQCTLCQDDNAATYNTRWNKEVVVNGITKSCGDFNSLLATQEKDSETCSLAKDAIFTQCCFAGSDTLIAIANQASTESDAPCSLCQPGQIGISADVIYNNSPSTCIEVYNFLKVSQKESSTTCKSAQVKLSEDCCRESGMLGPSEELAFGEDVTTNSGATSDGQGAVTAEKTEGKVVTPPMEFDTWSRRPSGAKESANAATLYSFIIGAISIGLFFTSY